MQKRYFIAGWVLLSALMGFGDDGTRSICGNVIKPNGRPAKAAEVNLITEFRGNAKLIASTQTDRNGAFCLHGIAPGKYHIDANSYTHNYSVWCDMQAIELVSDMVLSIELKRDVCVLTCMPTYSEIKDPPMTKVWQMDELHDIFSGSVRGR